MNPRQLIRVNSAVKMFAIVLIALGFSHEIRASDPVAVSLTEEASISIEQQILTAREAVQRLEKEVDKQKAIMDALCKVRRDPRFKLIPLNAHEHAVNEEILAEGRRKWREVEAISQKIEVLNSRIDELCDLIQHLHDLRRTR